MPVVADFQVAAHGVLLEQKAVVFLAGGKAESGGIQPRGSHRHGHIRRRWGGRGVLAAR